MVYVIRYSVIFCCALIFLSACEKFSGLDIKEDKALEFKENESTVIKGSSGDVDLTIGSIKRGTVKVSIQGIENNETYYSGVIAKGDHRFFKYGNHYYRININSVEESLFFSDKAAISFRRIPDELGTEGIRESKEKEKKVQQARDSFASKAAKIDYSPSTVRLTENGTVQGGSDRIQIVQRHGIIIRGSDGQGDVYLSVGDVTKGEAKVVVKSDDKILFNEYLSRAQFGVFKYSKNYFKLILNSFEEHTFHDDIAFLSIESISPKEGELLAKEYEKETEISASNVRGYIRKIELSSLDFLRNGEIWSCTDMATHLETKYEINYKDVHTVNDFVKVIINNSYLTGEEYGVVLENGEAQGLVEWLELN